MCDRAHRETAAEAEAKERRIYETQSKEARQGQKTEPGQSERDEKGGGGEGLVGWGLTTFEKRFSAPGP